jgi:hypothetical protein
MKSLMYLSIVTLLTALVGVGQTTPPSSGCGRTALSADLSPSNLVPPAQDRTESGQADVEITLVDGGAGASDTGVVSFNVTLENADAATFTGFAIHDGGTGLNGPAVVQFQFDTAEPPTGNTLSGQTMVTGSTQLDALRAIVDDPEGFYVLLAAEGSPSGLLRGQLESDDMSGEVDSLSDKVDRIQEQLDTIQLMVHRVGRVLGISPELLPMPETEPSGDDNGSTSN